MTAKTYRSTSEVLVVTLLFFFQLLILLIDYLVPASIAVGLLYVIPTVFSFLVVKSVKVIRGLIALELLFIVFGFFLTPQSDFLQWPDIVNRSLCIVVILLTAIISYNLKRLLDKARSVDNITKTTLEAAPAAMVMVNKLGQILLANKKASEIFGYEYGELLGESIDRLVPDDTRDVHPNLRKQFFENPEPRPMGTGRDLFGKRKDGTKIPVEIGLTPIETSRGLCVVSSIVDISMRKESESKLAQTMRDLQVSNDELEKFAYVTSHDLKTPLRGIGDLTEYLEEDLEGYMGSEGANPDVRKNLTRIFKQVRRMNNLIQGVLEYSSVSTKKSRPQKVNLKELVALIVADLRIPKTSWVLHNDLVFSTIDTVQLEQILSNLIGNAKKYHDNEEKMLIEIFCVDRYNEIEISISDNGPGIDPQFHKKIFDVFQTLQPKDEVESAGIGLSIVKKAVENHGGSISIDSKPGHGTRFTFTWPKVMEEENEETI